MKVQYFCTLRSPYCYLATPRLADLEARYSLSFEIRHLYPHFMRDPEGVFADERPMRGRYAARDIKRVADRLGTPIRAPRPDPVSQDRETGRFLDEQPDFPLLARIIHLGVLAAEQGRGMAYLMEVGRLLWSGETVGWNQPEHLGPALARAGLDLATLDAQAEREAERIEAQVARNASDQLASGHWGTPLMAFEGEPFFGQDRIEDLVWRLKQSGLKERTA